MHDMWKQYFVEGLLKGTIRYPSTRRFSPKIMRIVTEQISQIFPLNQEQIHIADYPLNHTIAEKISPLAVTSNKIILYFHGGGFCLGSLKTHRSWVCDIVQATKLPVIHFAYPLAPETTFPDSAEAIYQAYMSLLESGIEPQNIILAGDDSGANIALTLALRLVRQKTTTLPCALLLLSPFLDLTLTSGSVRYNQKHDALLSPKFLQQAINNYLQNTDYEAENPRVSPLYADLSGLPPLLIQVGSKSLLMDDAKRLKDMADTAEVKAVYKLYTGMWHNFFMFNAWFDEGRTALQDLAHFVDQFKHED